MTVFFAKTVLEGLSEVVPVRLLLVWFSAHGLTLLLRPAVRHGNDKDDEGAGIGYLEVCEFGHLSEVVFVLPVFQDNRPLLPGI